MTFKRLSQRAFALLQRHQRVDDELRRELARTWPDPWAVQRLKKLKLAIKDRLQRTASPI